MRKLGKTQSVNTRVEDISVNNTVVENNTSRINLFHGEALTIIEMLSKKGIKVDAIITDPPYGTITKDNSWDIVIPMDKMWESLKTVLKPNGVVVLFGNEPFSSELRQSNIKNFKYEWIWEKTLSGNYKAVKTQPRKNYETIMVFSEGQSTYNHQRRDLSDETRLRKFNKLTWSTKNKPLTLKDYNKHYLDFSNIENVGYPKAVLKYSNQTAECNNMIRVHPTQKPIQLMEYLVKTYTNQDEIVLDFTMGSGSTGVACKNLKRKFIGIELDKDFFTVANDRIKNAIEGSSLNYANTEVAILERMYRCNLDDKACEVEIVNKKVDSLLLKRAIGTDLNLLQETYNLSEDELYQKPMEKTGLSKRTLQRYKQFASEERFNTFRYADYEKLARKSLNGILDMTKLSDEDFEKAANGSKAVFKKPNKPTEKALVDTTVEVQEAEIKSDTVEDIITSTEAETNVDDNCEALAPKVKDYMQYNDVLTNEQCENLGLFDKDDAIELLITELRNILDTPLTNLYEKTKEDV